MTYTQSAPLLSNARLIGTVPVANVRITGGVTTLEPLKLLTLYLDTRLALAKLELFATHKLPLESNASPLTLLSVDPPPEVSFLICTLGVGVPLTLRSAAFHLTMVLAAKFTSQRFPLASKAKSYPFEIVDKPSSIVEPTTTLGIGEPVAAS